MSFMTDMQRSLTPEQQPLYLAGWRVWGEPGGARLECIDTFSGNKQDFGLHESAERAWEVAALIVGKQKAITTTSNRG